VHGAIEPPYRGRGYVEKRRRVEGGVFKFLFLSVQISRTRFILRGGRFVTPRFSERIKTQKLFIKLYNYVCCTHATAYFIL
jgi:hypothetical protein